MDHRGRQRPERAGGGSREAGGRNPSRQRDHAGPAGADQARRVRQPDRERLHPARGQGGRQAGYYGDPHLPGGVAVLDVQARGVPQEPALLARLSASQALTAAVMRFGFFFWPYSPEYTQQMARLGERWGFEMVGIADTPGNALDPWVAMTLAAQVTSRVTLATCVTNLVTRHPSITASAAASVDRVAGGRTILGVGAGHSGVANVGGAPARADDLREGIAFLKTALGGAPAAW